MLSTDSTNTTKRTTQPKAKPKQEVAAAATVKLAAYAESRHAGGTSFGNNNSYSPSHLCNNNDGSV